MSFDRLAPHYRWMERVLAGRKLQRCRTEFLGKIQAPKRALSVGEGNGRFLAEFVARFPRAEILCLDASERMVAESKRVIGGASNVNFLHADIFDWAAPRGEFDLIVTNFFLDCFTPRQLSIVIEKLASAAKSEATWLLADFCEPPNGWKKWRARTILASMYLFFRLAARLPARRLAAPDNFLTAHGFALVERLRYDWGLLHADFWGRGS